MDSEKATKYNILKNVLFENATLSWDKANLSVTIGHELLQGLEPELYSKKLEELKNASQL